MEDARILISKVITDLQAMLDEPELINSFAVSTQARRLAECAAWMDIDAKD
jgi:hypothetical protein